MKQLFSLPFFVALAAALFSGPSIIAQVLDMPTSAQVLIYGKGYENQISPEEMFSMSIAIPELGIDYSEDALAENAPINMFPVAATVVPGKSYTLDVSGTYLGNFQVRLFSPGFTVEVDSIAQSEINGQEGGNYTFRVVPKRGTFAGRAGESTSLATGKVYWQVSLGSLKNGDPARSLAIIDAATGAWSDLFTPAGLSLQSSSPEVVRIGSPIRQVFSNEAIVDVVTVNSTSYELRFYNPATTSISGGNVLQGNPYTITSGNPYLKYTISQDTSTGNANRLKIVRTDYNGDGSVARTSQTASERTGNDITDYQWRLDHWHDTSALTPPVIEKHQWSVNAAGNRVDSITIENASGVISSRLTKEYSNQSGSYELYRITRGTSNPVVETFDLLNWKSVSGGIWEAFHYDSHARVTQVFRPYGTDEIAPTSTIDPATWSGERTAYTYTGPSGLGRVGSIKNYLGSIQLGETMITYSDLSSSTANGMRIVTAARAEKPDANGAVLTTTTKYYREDVADAFYRNRIHSISHPDGTKESFAYQRGSFSNGSFSANGTGSGSYARTVTIAGIQSGSGSTISSIDGYTIDSINIVANKSTKSVVIRDANARIFRTESQIWNGSTWQTVGFTEYVYDYANRPTERRSSNGTIHETAYESGRLRSVMDDSGVKVSYTYDSAGRVETATKEGGPTTTFTYDADGHVRTETISGLSQTSIVNSWEYDDAGRLKNQTPAGLGTTNYGYNPDARTRTVTLPTLPGASSGETRTETFRPDGRLLKVDGSAVVARHYSYGVEVGLKYTQINVGTSASARWTKSKSDWLGRPKETRRPGFSTQGDFVETYTYASGKHRLEKLERTGYAPILYEYDELSRLKRTGLDLGIAGLDVNSADRITDYNQYLESWNNALWLRSDVTTYGDYDPLSNSSPAISAFTRQRLITDPNSTVQAEVQVTDAENVTVTTQTTVDRLNKTVTITTTRPGFTGTETQVFTNGLLASGTGHDGLQSVIEYDSLTRLWRTRDSRGNYITNEYYPGTSLLKKVTDDAGNAVTTIGYDPLGRTAWTQDANSQTTYLSYTARSQLERRWGSATNPIEYGYDSTYGDLTTQKTYRGGANWHQSAWPGASETGDTTTWYSDPATGLTASKTDAKTQTVSLTYNQRGQIATRTLARNVTTTYEYDPSTAELTGITYSDSTTPIGYEYNRLGQVKSVDDVTGARIFTYDPSKPWRLAAEALSGFYNDRRMTSVYDNSSVVGRYLGFKVGPTVDSSADLEQVFGFTGSGRYDTLATKRSNNGVTRTFQYGYRTDSALIDQLTIVGEPNFRVSYGYEENRDLLMHVDSLWNNVSQTRYDYTYNALAQRVTSKQSGTAFNDYGASTYYRHSYTSRGELSESIGYLGENVSATNAPLPGRHFAYSYDPIGNRKSSSRSGAAGAPDLYTRNELNQYDNRENNVVHLAGTARADSGISITGGATNAVIGRQGRYWNAQTTVNNTNNPAKTDFTVKATLPGNPDTVRTESPTAHVGQDLQTFSYDADGNLTGDGIWTYIYNAENQLVSMTPTTAAMNAGFPQRKLEFKYDYLGRRVQKKVSVWNPASGVWSPESERRFLYDGWNLVAEYSFNFQLSTFNIVRSYSWGLDLTGSRTATGGIGALLQIADHPTGNTYLPTYDGNGNIASLLNASNGNIAAIYEYSPFGELIRDEVRDTTIADNPFRFSTKFTDVESGLVYYGLRYYSPSLGRFINRDPIEETGGLNLYGFCGNDPTNCYDVLGLDDEYSRDSWYYQVTTTTVVEKYDDEGNLTSRSVTQTTSVEILDAGGSDVSPGGTFKSFRHVERSENVRRTVTGRATPIAPLLDTEGFLRPRPEVPPPPFPVQPRAPQDQGLTLREAAGAFLSGLGEGAYDVAMAFRAMPEGLGALAGAASVDPLGTLLAAHDTITTNLANGYILASETSLADVRRDIVMAGDLYVNDREFRQGITEAAAGSGTGISLGALLGNLVPKAAETTAAKVWPKTAAEMDDFLKVPGKKIPDTPTTPGRSKTVWEPNSDTKITLEQHPYHPNAPEWHKGAHWHLDTPGKPHQRFLPGDPIPGN